MTVNVLVVEDDNEFFGDLESIFVKMGPDILTDRAISRDAAIAALSSKFYDFVVLDLRIPPNDESLETDPQHGRAVFQAARREAPGTPVFVLTGSPAEEFIPELLSQAQQMDIWSTGTKGGTISFLRKVDFDKFPDRVLDLVSAVRGLADVEIVFIKTNLSIEEDRLLRIFTRKVGGVTCRVSVISGGLSDARVFRVKVTDKNGARVHDAVAKLGSLELVRDESERFDAYISRLEPKSTPRRLATMEHGARRSGGVFYGLAEGFEHSGFDVAFDGVADVSLTIQGVEAGLTQWLVGVPETRQAISYIRQRVLSDSGTRRVVEDFGLDWVPDFEKQQVQVKWSPIHGDLHGANVLVSKDGASVFIDYGDVGEGPASLDPVTLELSLLFHPQRRGGDWPNSSQAENWGDVEKYTEGCPYPDFVVGCRAWAMRVAAGKREVLASAYAYLLRQLKYQDTDKMLCLSLLEGVRKAFAGT